jgi:hypothetical protein
MKYIIHDRKQVKKTSYELVQEPEKEKYRTVKIGLGGKVTFLQPSNNLISASSMFDRIILEANSK